MERQIGNFVKAIAQGVFSTTMTQVIQDLEQRKSELDTQIQTEHVRNALMEDEASIGAFFKKFAQAKLSDPDTRDMLLEYFIDSIWLGPDGVTIASWFYENGEHITWEELVEAKKARGHAELVREFDMTPLCGDGEN